ncbi:hypothetical protein [Clostridium sp. KNHs216]|uniref:hypothetical protein n=1 Tax=Clostridium sp. KNHs216 TaxID=1550235 RepID=UPI001152F01A|nr:hypothetical protein [Clostridium sp. KNHs216]TQI66273.1 hypothetical protein LY85_0934 [Clostridium sp. KNHs216]
MWIQPIYDRTESDTANKTAKGHYNADDLNRIEQDCEYLAGIFGVTISTREWARTDFPTVSEMERIRSNIETLRTAYIVYQTTPNTPPVPLNEYHKANDIERILNDLKALYDANKSNVMYAGEAYSGQLIGVI